MAKRVSSEDFEAEVLGSDLPVVVEFYSDSCIPCKQLSPILGGLEDDYEDQVKVVKVNVNFDAGLAQKYEVAASPTLLFFKDGSEVERIRGLVKRPKLEETVKKVIIKQEDKEMLVTVAGEKKEIEQGTTIAKLIVDEKVENPDYVTVTVNDDFVESEDFDKTEIKENDVIEFLYFMGGGAF
ncbi:MAG: sulfur carrier protein ThiS [Eubacterium sp.]